MSDNPRQKSAGQPPVSSHPAFRVIVAVWFAALLGIGSMVLPIGLIERFAVASGLSDAFTAAQPPLGASAQLIVGLGAAVIGALLGLVVARLVAAANSARAAGGSAADAVAADAKRPLSAHEDLFEGGLDADGVAPAHDEIIDRDGTPGEFPEIAPLPGAYWDDEKDPLDARAFDEADDALSPAFLHHGESQRGEPATDLGQADSQDRAFASEPVAERAPVPPVCGRPLGELGMVELVERFAIALDRHRTSASIQPDAAEAGAPSSTLRPLEFGNPLGHERGHHEDDLPNFDDEIEEEVAAEYPSLLAIKTSSGREPVRLELTDADAVDDPVLVFPAQTSRAAMTGSGDETAGGRSLDAALARAQAAADAANRGGSDAPASPAGGTERALRNALEKLQRLSGAA